MISIILISHLNSDARRCPGRRRYKSIFIEIRNHAWRNPYGSIGHPNKNSGIPNARDVRMVSSLSLWRNSL